jgi:hypothetical protein
MYPVKPGKHLETSELGSSRRPQVHGLTRAARESRWRLPFVCACFFAPGKGYVEQDYQRMRSVKRFLRTFICCGIVACPLMGSSILAAPSACSEEDNAMHATHTHGAMSMPMDASVDAATQAKLLADKSESEFNHHLAGLLVVLAGLFVLADGDIRERWPSLHIWPLCFLVSGLFVLIFSDTELWPFASQSWYFGLRHHAEVLQHKLFAVLLLGVGVIELQRARGVLKAAWSGWVFPVLAVAGSLLLFFHDHEGGMHGPNHIELMHRIQSQHFDFAVTGFGIALSKGLAEKPSVWQPFFERLFATLLIVLGALLLVYAE